MLLASLSEISILVIAVVSGCVLVLILLCSCLAVKFYKRRRRGEDLEMNAQEPKRKDPEPKRKDPQPKRKDPTVW